MQDIISVITHKQVQDLTRLFNINGLCQYFDISEKTAYNLVKSREFPAFKVSGQYRIMVDELPKWMAKQSKVKK